MIQKQEGSVLVISLIMLVLLSLLGIMSARTAEIELRIANNHKLHTQAFYHAESGISVAKAINLYAADLPPEFAESVVIEEVIGSNPKRVIVTSTGYSPNEGHPGYATSVVEAGFEVKTGWETDLKSALYVGENLTSNGAASMANGSDPEHTTEECKAWDVMSTEPPGADNDYEATNWDGQTGTPPELHNDQPPIAFDELFDHLKKWAQVVKAENNLTLGDMDSPRGVYEVVDVDGVRINNLDGYGVLLVNGNMEVDLGGSIGWNGIIMVRGDLTFNGGGTKEIYGAVLSSGNTTDNGSVDIYWDCTVMEMLKEKYTKYKMIWWRQP